MQTPELVFDGDFEVELQTLSDSQRATYMRDFDIGVEDIGSIDRGSASFKQGIWRGRQLRARAALEIFRGWQE